MLSNQSVSVVRRGNSNRKATLSPQEEGGFQNRAQLGLEEPVPEPRKPGGLGRWFRFLNWILLPFQHSLRHQASELTLWIGTAIAHDNTPRVN